MLFWCVGGIFRQKYHAWCLSQVMVWTVDQLRSIAAAFFEAARVQTSGRVEGRGKGGLGLSNEALGGDRSGAGVPHRRRFLAFTRKSLKLSTDLFRIFDIQGQRAILPRCSSCVIVGPGNSSVC